MAAGRRFAAQQFYAWGAENATRERRPTAVTTYFFTVASVSQPQSVCLFKVGARCFNALLDLIAALAAPPKLRTLISCFLALANPTIACRFGQWAPPPADTDGEASNPGPPQPPPATGAPIRVPIPMRRRRWLRRLLPMAEGSSLTTSAAAPKMSQVSVDPKLESFSR